MIEPKGNTRQESASKGIQHAVMRVVFRIDPILKVHISIVSVGFALLLDTWDFPPVEKKGAKAVRVTLTAAEGTFLTSHVAECPDVAPECATTFIPRPRAAGWLSVGAEKSRVAASGLLKSTVSDCAAGTAAGSAAAGAASNGASACSTSAKFW